MQTTATRAACSKLGFGVALFALACEPLTQVDDGESARLRVLLTDAPHELLESAVVTIGAVHLVPGDGEPHVLLTDDGGEFDLLDLRNGVTAELADLEIPAGRYTQLRMIVTSAEVTLLEGYEFRDGSRTQSLKVPSGPQSGIKISLHAADQPEDGEGELGEGIEITGEETLVVDFDVAQNFKLQGNPNTPAGIKGFLFTPHLRAVVLTDAGSISGTVTVEGGAPVVGASVSATPLEMGEVAEGETAVAMALTGEDGTYTIWFLRPGDYRVAVESDAGTADPQDVSVGPNEDVVGVDFELTLAS